MKNRLSKCLIALLLLFRLLSLIVYADDSASRSIVGDFFNKVFDIELTNGKTMFETYEDIDKRAKLNTDILNGDATDKTYSLYDRFGGSIKFVPYFGETKISTSLLDRFYTKYMNNEDDFSLSVSDIKLLFEAPAISNNVIYNDRPNVLSSDTVENGSYDPRVAAYSGISSVGGDASLGNLSLSISNFFTQVVANLSGGSIFHSINDVFNTVCSEGLSDLLEKLLYFVLPLAIGIFLIFLVRKAFTVIKGTFSLRKLLFQVASCVISLALIFSLIANPTSISDILDKFVTIIDDTLDKALAIGSDEVIYSDNIDNVRIATLWKTVIFEPWCEGTFGDKYENLYTQFDTNDKHTKLQQDRDDVFSDWPDRLPRYNSMQLTGDVVVPLGKTETRNWAALAWSCQSIYHIDAVEDGSKTGIIQKDGIWPEGTVTPLNSSIYVDNFRWLDAMLNISPEYYSPEDIIQSYANARPYKQTFIKSGLSSMWLALLLIPILLLSIKKMKEAVLLIFGSFRLIYHSVMGFVIPDEYDVLMNFKKLGVKLYDYFWWSFIVFIAINVYTIMMGKGLIVDLLWIFLGIYLNKFKPIRSSRRIMEIKNGIKRGLHKVGTGVKNKASQMFNK